MIDGGGKRINTLKEMVHEMYYAARYRKWVVYDSSNVTVVHIGTRRECVDIQKSSSGLTVIPYLNN